MTEVQTSVLRLIQAMFNAAPNASILDEFSTIVEDSGGSTVPLANLLAANPVFTSEMYPDSLSNTEFGVNFIENVVGESASASAKVWAANEITSLLNGGMSRGEVMAFAADELASVSVFNADWGDAGVQFRNKVEVASAYAIEAEGQGATLDILQTVTAQVTQASETVDAAIAAFTEGFDGVVVDGYVSGATVFVDVDGDGVQDPDEPTTTTDAQGNFTFPPGTDLGQIISKGGTDIATGQPFEGALTAPAGSTVVNPLTTLIDEISKTPGATVDSAREQVLTALGLDANTDLQSFDPLAVLTDPTESDERKALALKVQAAAAQVVTIVQQTAAILEGTGTTEDGTSAAFAAVADAISVASSSAGLSTDPDDPDAETSDGTIDLTSTTSIGNIVKAAASEAGASTEQQAAVDNLADDTSTIITNLNSAIDDAVGDGTGDVEDTLNTIAQVQVVSGNTADTVEEQSAGLGDISNAASSTSGDNLTDSIDAASTEIGDVNGDGQSNATSTTSGGGGGGGGGTPTTFTVTETAGVVEFGGTASGDITVAWAGTIGDSVATFTRGGIDASTEPDFETGSLGTATTITLATGQTLSMALADATTLLANIDTIIDGDGAVALTDTTTAAGDLTTIEGDAKFDVDLDASDGTTLTGTGAEFDTLIGNAAITLASNFVANVSGTPTIAQLNTIDGATTATVTATPAANTVANLLTLTGSNNAYTLETTDAGSIAASDLNTLDSKTSVAIDADSIATLTGTGAELSTALGSAGINTAAGVALTVTGSITTAQQATLDGNTTAAITATISDGDMTTLAGITDANANNALTITVTDTSVDAAALNTLDGKTSVNVDATAATTLTGAGAAIDTAVNAGTIDTAAAVNVTVSDTIAATLVDSINGGTNGTITATVTADDASSLDGDLNGATGALTLTVTGGNDPADLNSLDALTTVTIDASGTTSLNGSTADTLTTIGGDITLPANVPITLSDNPSVANANTVDGATSGVVTATFATATLASFASLTGTGNAYMITINDAGTVAASDLSTLDGKTTVAVDATSAATISGTGAELSTALGSAGINTAAGVALSVTGSITTAQEVTLDGSTTAVITATISDGDMATLAGIADANGNNALTITVTDTSVAAAALNTLDTKTTVSVTATAANTITGAAADVATSLAAAGSTLTLAADVDATVNTGTASVAQQSAMDGDTTGTITATITENDLTTLAGLVDANGNNALTVTVTDGTVDATALNTLDGKTSVQVDASASTTLNGAAAAINTALAAAGLDLSGLTSVAPTGSITSAEQATMDDNTTLAITATISDNDMTTLANLTDDNGNNALTVTVTDASVDATALNTLDGKTSVAVTATAVGTLTGTASAISTALGSAGITTAAGVAATVDSGTATTAQQAAIDGNTTGVVTATISDNDMTTLAGIADANANNALTITVTDTTVAAGALNTLDGKTTENITATAITTLTGTAADIATAIVSAGLSLDLGVGATLDAGTISAGDLDTIETNTSADVNMSAVTTVTMASADDLSFNGTTVTGETFALNGTGNNGGETFTVNLAPGGETVDLSNITVDTDDISVVINGNSGADDITATNADDTINAMAGGDSITGGTGADTIDLGSSDTAADTVVQNAGDSADTGAISDVSGGGGIFASTDTISTTGADVISNFEDDTDKIAVSSSLSAATQDVSDGDGGVGTGEFTVIRGDNSGGTFTVDTASGADLLLLFDANGAGDVEMLVLDGAGGATFTAADFSQPIPTLNAATAAGTGLTEYHITDTSAALAALASGVLNTATNITTTDAATISQATTLQGASNSGATNINSVSDTANAISLSSNTVLDLVIGTVTASTDATADEAALLEGFTKAVSYDISDTASALAAASSAELDAAGTVNITGSASTADISTIDGNTTSSLDLSGVTTLTGTAASIVTAFGTYADLVAAYNATITGSASTADIAAIDADTSGTLDLSGVTELSGTAASIVSAFGSYTDLVAAYNATITGSASTADIALIDADTAGTLDLSGVTELTGTAAAIVSAFGAYSDLPAGYNATITGSASTADVAAIDADTSGTLDLSGVTELTGTAASIVSAFGAYSDLVAAYNATITGTASTTDIAAIDADTAGTLDLSGVTELTGTAASIVTAFGTYTDLVAAYNATITGSASTADIASIDADTAGTLDLSGVTDVSGTAANIVSAFGTYASLDGDYNATITGSASNSDIALIDADTSGTLNLAGVTDISGTAAEIVALFASLDGDYNATVTGSASIADMNSIAGDTSGTIDFSGVTAVSGTASDIVTAFGAYASLDGDYNATITGSASTADIGSIDTDTSGTLDLSGVTDVSGTAAAIVSAFGTYASLDGDYNATITGSASSSDIALIDADTSGTLNLAGVTDISGTAAEIVALFASLDGDYNATVTGSASIADMNSIAGDTSGTVDFSGVTAVSGTASDVVTAFGAYASLDGDYNATLTGSATTANIASVDSDTSGTLDLSGITNLTGSAADIISAFGTYGDLPAAYNATVTGTLSVAQFDSIDADTAGTIDLSGAVISDTVANLTGEQGDFSAATSVTAIVQSGDTNLTDNALDGDVDTIDLNGETVTLTAAQGGLTITANGGTYSISDSVSELTGDQGDLSGATAVTVVLASGGADADISAVGLDNDVDTIDLNGEAATMTQAQHQGFTGITAGGGSDSITLTTAGAVTADADVETYSIVGTSNITVNASATGVDINGDIGNQTVTVNGLTVTGDYALSSGTDELTATTGADITGVNSGAATTAETLNLTGTITMTQTQHEGFTTFSAAGGSDQVTLTTAGTVTAASAIETYSIVEASSITLDAAASGFAGLNVTETGALGTVTTVTLGTGSYTGTYSGLETDDVIQVVNGTDISGATGLDAVVLDFQSATAAVTLDAAQNGSVTYANAGTGTQTVNVDEADTFSANANIEAYGIVGASQITVSGSATGVNITGEAATDQTVVINGLTVTGTWALDTGTDVLSATDGADISGVNSGAATTAESLTLADNASITMTGAQNDGFTGTITANGAETIVITGNDNLTTLANIETYTVGDDGGDDARTIGVSAAGTSVAATSGSDAVTFNLGGLTYTGTIDGENSAADTLSLADGADIDAGTINNVANLTLASGASVTMSRDQHLGFSSGTLTATGSAQTVNLTGDGAVTVLSGIETYTVGDDSTDSRTITLGAVDADVTASSGTDAITFSINDSVGWTGSVTGEGTVDDTLLLADGSDIRNGTVTNVELLELASGASVTMNRTTHEGFTSATAAGTESITVTSTGSVTALAGIENYTIGDEITVNGSTTGVNITGGATDDTVNVAGLTVTGTYALGSGADVITATTGADISGVNSGAATTAETISMAGTVTMTRDQHEAFTTFTAAGGSDQITLTSAGTVTAASAIETYSVVENSTVTVGAAALGFAALSFTETGSNGDVTTFTLGTGAYTGTWTGLEGDDVIQVVDGTDISGATGLNSAVVDFQSATATVTISPDQNTPSLTVANAGTGTQTITLSGADTFTANAFIEAYNIVGASDINVPSAAAGVNITGEDGTDQTITISPSGVSPTGTWDLGTGTDVLSAVNLTDLRNVNSGAATTAESLTLASGALITMTPAQNAGFTGTITAPGSETVNIFGNDDVTLTLANIEQYTLGDDTDDSTRSITVTSATVNVNGQVSDDAVTFNLGSLTYTGTIFGEGSVDDIISLSTGADISGASINTVEALTLASGASVTMSQTQHAGFTGAVTAPGSETINITGDGAVTTLTAIESYGIGDDSGNARTVTVSAAGTSVTATSVTDAVTFDLAGLTYTGAITGEGTVDDILDLDDGADISGGTISAVEALTLASGASVTMNRAQHEGFTGAVTAGGTEQITLTSAGTVTGLAAIETYVLGGAGANTITIGATTTNVTTASDGSNQAINTGSQSSYTGTITGNATDTTVLEIGSGNADVSGATLNIGAATGVEVLAQGSNSVTVSSAQHDSLIGISSTDAITGSGTVTIDTNDTSITADASPGAYVLTGLGANTITLAAAGQDITTAAVSSAQIVDLGSLTSYTGTFTGNGTATDTLLISTDATNISGATLTSVDEIDLANDVDATMTKAFHDLINAGTGDNTVTFTDNVTSAATLSSVVESFVLVAGANSVTTSAVSQSINADALLDGEALTVAGSTAASVSLVAGDLSGGSYTGALTVTATTGTNVITTGSGNDSITGGAGDDTITTNAGTDAIVFADTAANNGADTISDFTTGSDTLDFSAFETAGSTVEVTGALSTTAGTVYYLTGASAGDADSAAAAAAALNTAGTWTDADATAWVVVSDDDSAAVYEWTDTAASGDEVAAGELTLVATITGTVASGDLVI